VVALEEAIGPLVERTRGGANGGGSSLTPTARELLARFDRLVAAYEGVARVDETVLGGAVIDRDGELATV
jgi:molybdate transport system regulatory protein